MICEYHATMGMRRLVSNQKTIIEFSIGNKPLRIKQVADLDKMSDINNRMRANDDKLKPNFLI